MSMSQTFDIILSDRKSNNRRQVFQYLAAELSKTIGLREQLLADRLLDKNRQANCSIGGGVAVADLRLSSLTAPMTVLVRLTHKVDFEASDSQDVDIVALMLSPERDGPQHLARLSKLSRSLRDAQFCDSLRHYREAEDIRTFLKNREASLQSVARAAA